MSYIFRQKKGSPEFDIQCRIIRWMHYQFPGILFTISVGGVRLPLGLAVKMKRAGYRKGTPDIQVFEPRGEYHGLFIELKTDGGQPDEEGNQQRFIDELIRRGYKAMFCYGQKMAEATVTDYMALNSKQGEKHG